MLIGKKLALPHLASQFQSSLQTIIVLPSLCSFPVPLPLWQGALDPSLSQRLPVKVNANNTRDLPELHQESCVHNLSSKSGR